MKICTKCNKTKALSAFNNSKRGAQGKQRYCRACQKAHYAANKAKRVAQSGASKLARRGAIYGLTPEEHDTLRASNNGLCHLCNRKKAVHIDHDHITGAVRGHLCMSCNTALGKLGDSVEGLTRALQYLRKLH